MLNFLLLFESLRIKCIVPKSIRASTVSVSNPCLDNSRLLIFWTRMFFGLAHASVFARSLKYLLSEGRMLTLRLTVLR